MLAVFEKTIGKPPVEMNISSGWKVPKTRWDVPGIFREAWPQSTFYNFSNGNFMALAHPSTTAGAGDRPPAHPRSFVVTDDVFCIFMGNIDNISDLRRHYGLTRHTNEAMLVVEVYKVYRDRAPYPADQIIKDLTGKFAFVLFDANCGTLFTARDRHGGVKLHWGVAEDESVVFSDDGEGAYL